jgi:hypothetical protein
LFGKEDKLILYDFASTAKEDISPPDAEEEKVIL